MQYARKLTRYGTVELDVNADSDAALVGTLWAYAVFLAVVVGVLAELITAADGISAKDFAPAPPNSGDNKQTTSKEQSHE